MHTGHSTRLSVGFLITILAAASTARSQTDITGLAGLKARSIGPSGMSGRISAIDAVNADPNIIYVGAATGGLWKSTSGGVTWTPLTDSLPASSVGAVAIYQAAPELVWIGTGERGRRNSAGVGTGVYKSLDGGKSWQHVGLESTGAISEIVLHPSNPDVAYVGALGNTWKESEDRGVYKTTDGGKSWEKVLYVNETTGAGDLAMDPANPNHLMAAMWDHRRWPWFFRSGGAGSGLHVTYDGGESWKRLSPREGLPEGELGRMGLAFAPGNLEVVYAVVEAKHSVMMRSDDRGETWKVVSDRGGLRSIARRPFYFARLVVDPVNENRVYNLVGTLNLSEDGGKNFRRLQNGRVHGDHHALWVSLDGKILIDGNDGGVSLSHDRGASWRFIENLPLGQFYKINVDLATPFNVMGGLQDNSMWHGPSSVWHNGGVRFSDWKEVGSGDGFATLAVPGNSRYVYSTREAGYIVRSDLQTGERHTIGPAHPEGIDLRYNWNPGMAIDPHDGSLYFGSQFVHGSTDMGTTWTLLSPDLTTNDPEKQMQDQSGGLSRDDSEAENHTAILTIAPSPVERGVLWVGTDDGNVQLTRDGGGTWLNVVERIEGVRPNTWVPHIEASKFEGGTAFVTFDDHRRGDNTPYVFKTMDYGNTWTSLVTADIEPFNFVHVIEQDPVEANLLFLGTEHGMYVSLNGGQKWHLWRHGLPRAPTRALVVHPRDHDLVIATHGRSVYILDDVGPLRALARDPAISNRPLHVFEVPVATRYQRWRRYMSRGNGDGMFIGENRPYGALVTYSIAPTAESADGATTKVSVEVLDDAGATVRTFEGPAEPGVNRTAWDLRRNPIRLPPAEVTSAPSLHPGPQVLPGRYTVRIELAGEEVCAAVEVREDPRFDVPIEAQREKLDFLITVGQRVEVATEAVNRLRYAKRAVDRVVEQVQANRGASDNTAKALASAGGDLREALTDVEVLFTGDTMNFYLDGGPQRIQGMESWPDDVLPQLLDLTGDGALDTYTPSRDAPTEAERLHLQAAEEDLKQALERTNRIFAEEVARFRERVAGLDAELLPVKEPLSIDWK